MEWDKEYEMIVTKPEYLQETITKDLKVSEHMILGDLAKQPTLYAKWGYFESRAEEALRVNKAYYENCLAVTREAVRSNTTKKLTVAETEDRALQQTAVQNFLKNYLDSQTIAHTIRRVREAIAQKHSMIQSINSRQKTEMEIERSA